MNDFKLIKNFILTLPQTTPNLDIITQRIKNFEYQLLKLLKVYKFTYNQNYVLSYQIKIINGKIRKLLAIIELLTNEICNDVDTVIRSYKFDAENLV